MMETLFYDEAGARVFVSKGIARDDHTWFTVRQIGNKGTHQIKTKFLPIRKTAAEAEADLRAYAEKKGWRGEPPPLQSQSRRRKNGKLEKA
jgi:hypothetical protein